MPADGFSVDMKIPSTPSVKVAIAFSQNFSEEAKVRRAFRALADRHGLALQLFSTSKQKPGSAIDTIAAEQGIRPVKYAPADWRKGRIADYKRNQELVDAGISMVVLFLVKNQPNINAHDLRKRAEKKGVPVRIIWQENPGMSWQ